MQRKIPGIGLSLAVIIFLCLAYPVLTQDDGFARGGLTPASQSLDDASLRASSSAWTEWSGWSKCSRSCNGGIREQFRQCKRVRLTIDGNGDTEQNPQPKCEGGNKKYTPCQNRPCPGGVVSSRLDQCAKFNTRKFAGQNYFWEPMNRGGPCQLYCRARGHRFFVRQSSSVTDGSECGAERRGGRRRRGGAICVKGRCVQPGCDGVPGSRKVWDRCGVCGGGGKSCEFVSGLFRRESLSNDFHLVVTIPAGAKMINITEISRSSSYIALRSGNAMHQMYINGDVSRGHPARSQAYSIASTTFEYVRPFQSNRGESLRAEGPTSEPLDVLIFFQMENPGISYEYVLPKIVSQPPGSSPLRPGIPRRNGDHQIDAGDEDFANGRYNAQNGPVHPSIYRNPYQGTNVYSKPLGDRHTMPWRLGNFRRPLTAPRPWPRPNNDDVDRSAENSGSTIRRDAPPIVNRHMEIDGATYWSLRGYGPCSKSCAEGTRTQKISCVHRSTGKVIDERHCPLPRPKPSVKLCNKSPCPPYYHVSEWSPCSRSCGRGTRSRLVVCRQLFPGNFTTAVNHKLCRRLMDKPPSHERCKLQDCARWRVVGDWSPCSSKCGQGTQRRFAACKSGQSTTLPESACSAFRKPSYIRSCDAGPCLTKWFVTEWQACSADCDRGEQLRSVHCLNTARATQGCASHSKPAETRLCGRSSCGVKYEWFSGSWGACSSKCGAGHQTRTVICVRVEANGSVSNVEPQSNGQSPCVAVDKPATEQSCNTQSCGSRWYMTQWTECSVSCGGGSRSRDVHCLDEDGNYSSLCDQSERPRETERCNTANCITLADPSCVDKSNKCRAIFRARFCSIEYYRSRCCMTCSDPAAALQTRRLGKW